MTITEQCLCIDFHLSHKTSRSDCLCYRDFMRCLSMWPKLGASCLTLARGSCSKSLPCMCMPPQRAFSPFPSRRSLLPMYSCHQKNCTSGRLGAGERPVDSLRKAGRKPKRGTQKARKKPKRCRFSALSLARPLLCKAPAHWPLLSTSRENARKMPFRCPLTEVCQFAGLPVTVLCFASTFVHLLWVPLSTLYTLFSHTNCAKWVCMACYVQGVPEFPFQKYLLAAHEPVAQI